MGPHVGWRGGSAEVQVCITRWQEATGGAGIGGEQREREYPINRLVGLAWFGVAASACASISASVSATRARPSSPHLRLHPVRTSRRGRACNQRLEQRKHRWYDT